MKTHISLVGVLITALSIGCAVAQRQPREPYAGNRQTATKAASSKVKTRSFDFGKKGPTPKILVEPSDQFVKLGSSADFVVGAAPAIVTYQWRHNGVTIPGATSNVYHIASVTTNLLGYYECAVSTEIETKLTRMALLSGYTNMGNVTLVISYPPTDPPGSATSGCPFPAVARLRFPQIAGSYMTKIAGLPASEYWAQDTARTDTKITYQGNLLPNRGCGPNGFVSVVPGSSTYFFFMVYFPNTPPTNPSTPYYLSVSGFTP